MLRSMIRAAVDWMRAGLTLRSFKIVIYSREGAPPPTDLDYLLDAFDKYARLVNQQTVNTDVSAYRAFIIDTSIDDRLQSWSS